MHKKSRSRNKNGASKRARKPITKLQYTHHNKTDIHKRRRKGLHARNHFPPLGGNRETLQLTTTRSETDRQEESCKTRVRTQFGSTCWAMQLIMIATRRGGGKSNTDGEPIGRKKHTPHIGRRATAFAGLSRSKVGKDVEENMLHDRQVEC